MRLDAYGLEAYQVVWLAIMQCTAQGILISLLPMFLASKRRRNLSFKLYVVLVNLLSLAQTIGYTIQGFDALDPAPPRGFLALLAPVLTGIISVLVQPFFIHRCWRIFNQRILPIVPFLFLSLISMISAILVGVYAGQVGTTPDGEVKNKIVLGVWVFSSFALDFCTTLTTVVYLYRVWKEAKGQGSVFSAVWHITWASAAPPLILMIIVIIDRYTITGSTHTATTFAAGMTAKSFVLALMINLVGQGYVRQQFDQPRSSRAGDASHNVAGVTSEPVFAPTAGNAIELTVRPSPASTRVTEHTQEGHPKGAEDDPSLSQITILKAGDVSIAHGVHNVELMPEP